MTYPQTCDVVPPADLPPPKPVENGAAELREDAADKSTILLFNPATTRHKIIADWVQSAGFSLRSSSSSAQLLFSLEQIERGVILLNGELSRLLALVRTINQIPLSPPVIVLVETPDFHTVVNAFRSGVADVLRFPAERRLLLERLRWAACEDRRLGRQRDQYIRSLRLIGSLTPRERQVMRLIVHGSGNRQVATALSISERTVEAHRQRVMNKTQSGSLAELVRIDVIAKDGRFHAPRPVPYPYGPASTTSIWRNPKHIRPPALGTPGATPIPAAFGSSGDKPIKR